MSEYLQKRFADTNKRVAEEDEAKKNAENDKQTKEAAEREEKAQRTKNVETKWEADMEMVAEIVGEINRATIPYLETAILQGNAPEKIRPIAFRVVEGINAGLQIQLQNNGALLFKSVGRTRREWRQEPIDILSASREDFERILMDFVDAIDPAKA